MNEKYYVLIIKYENEETVRAMGPMNERRAERVENGASINLNHEDYYTLVETESEYNERCQVQTMLG